MTRPLKFRVWDVAQNKFLPSYGDLGIDFYHEQGESWHSKGIRDIVPVSWFLQDHNNNLGNYIVQEYTGYKDSDNKEIYEGDILKNLTPHKYSSDTFVVKWGEFEPSDDMGVGGVGFVLPWFYTTFKPKVIGNIFEHSELLK